MHRHNFFELLYIEYGTGNHILNSIHHNYKEHDIYLLTPKDYHS
ncbi:AraC family ligand binding domain-containing protein, partial [Flavobacterium hydatis]